MSVLNGLVNLIRIVDNYWSRRSIVYFVHFVSIQIFIIEYYFFQHSNRETIDCNIDKAIYPLS